MAATLLRPKAIPEVLGAANVDGIQTTMCAQWCTPTQLHMAAVPTLTRTRSAALPGASLRRRLIDRSGNLMAFSGEHSQQEVIKNCAIACNVWHLHSTPADKFADAGNLQCLVIDLEQARLVVSPSASYLVICRAAATTPLGLVKAKAQAVAQHLQPALSQISRG
jgi:hypothetical protein